MSADKNKAVVERMWSALSDMDWEAMKACMHPDIHYEDVPSDDPGARGPSNCVKRLQIAFNHLSAHEHTMHHCLAEGDAVLLNHTERWTFTTGEKAEHTFCTVHEMKDGLVHRWSDYWDMNKFVGQFPAWFLEEMAKSTAADFGD